MTQESGTWYVGRNGQQRGPFEWAAIQAQGAAGEITPHDMVWSDGMTEWASAATIPGLLPPAATVPLNYPPPMLGYLPADGVMYAGFWQRFAAVAIDAAVMWVVNFCIGFVVGFMIAVSFHRNDQLAGAIASIAGLVAGWLYESLLISSPKQATLGKMALGIRVVGEDGAQISFGRATGRYFAKILSGLILMIGYLMMLWTERKQTLHDSLARTLVLKSRP